MIYISITFIQSLSCKVETRHYAGFFIYSRLQFPPISSHATALYVIIQCLLTGQIQLITVQKVTLHRVRIPGFIFPGILGICQKSQKC